MPEIYMKSKLLIIAVMFIVTSGILHAQISFTLWNRAQVLPFEVTTTEGDKPHLASEIWWTRFMAGGHNGTNTIGFDAEVDFRYLTTQGTIFTFNDGISNFADQWALYYMWMKPVDWLFLQIGKYPKWGNDQLNLPFFDFIRYTNSIGTDVFSGYWNYYSASIPLGFLMEMYFGNFTVNLNFKSIDPTMPIGDYLRTVQTGLRWDVPGLGIFRMQMIGYDFNNKIPVKGNFDPNGDGLAKGINYMQPDKAGSQFQLAANITMFSGIKFALGIHYYLSKSEIEYDSEDTVSGFSFIADRGAICFPAYIQLNLFDPWTFYVKTRIITGRDRVFGQNLIFALAGAEANYKINDMLTARAAVSTVNFGTEIYGAELRQRKPALDMGIGLHIIYRYCQLQAGLVLRYDSREGTQLGWAIPVTFDFTLFNWN